MQPIVIYEEKLPFELSKQLQNGMNLYINCSHCNTKTIISLGLFEGNYVDWVTTNQCHCSHCSQMLTLENVIRIYFKNCEINFSGMIKEINKTFKHQHFHQELTSPYAYLDIDDFSVYKEFNLKICSFNTKKLPKKKLSNLVEEIFSFKEQRVDIISIKNIEIYDDLLLFREIFNSEKQIIEQEILYLQMEFIKLSKLVVAYTEQIRQKQEEIDNFHMDLVKNEAYSKQLLEDLEKEDQDIINTQNQIEYYKQRQRDLLKWCWVPGYSIYLLGRTLDDGLNKIPSLVKKRDTTVKDRDVLLSDIKNQSLKISELEDIVEHLKKEKKCFEEEKNVLSKKEPILSSELVYYNSYNRFFSELDITVESIEDKNKIFQNFLAIFDAQATFTQTDSIYGIYRDSFATLAKSLEERILNTPLKIPGEYYFLKME